MLRFHEKNFQKICRQLAAKDQTLKAILDEYGYPPMWTRPASFQTLVLTILEQQVSLASAYAAYQKLRDRIGVVTPKKLLALTDEEMRACYFTRQKMGYARGLAQAIIKRKLVLKRLHALPDDEVRVILKQHKGIGDWTVDVFLMHALRRTDLFPLGDIALVNSLKHVMQLPAHTTREELMVIAEPWKPFRTIASMILWHAYIKRKRIVLKG
jgi:DNA-3-methyladenine glycosylase II